MRCGGWIRARFAGLIVVALCGWIRPAQGIPVLARIYNKPCRTCHTVFPQLNPAGEDFRAHGLHGLPPAVRPIRLASWLDVPGTLPFALSVGAGGDVRNVDGPSAAHSTRGRFSMQFLSILAGGELGPYVSFLADYAPVRFDQAAGEYEIQTRPGLAFVQAHAEPWGWLGNLRVGLFELPLGTSPRVHRLSTRGYLIYGATAATLLNRPPPVTDGRGDILQLDSTQIGIEVSGQTAIPGPTWSIGVSNGSNNRVDNNHTKDLFLRIGQNVGLHRAGLFVYYSPDILGDGANDEVVRFGPDLTLYAREVRLVAQGLAGYDANPTNRSSALWYYGGFVEGNYRLTPRIISLLRGDYVGMPRFDDTANGGMLQVRRHRWEVTGGLQWLPIEKLKLVAEVTYGENHESFKNATVTNLSATLRVATAFWPLTPPGMEEWTEVPSPQ